MGQLLGVLLSGGVFGGLVNLLSPQEGFWVVLISAVILAVVVWLTIAGGPLTRSPQGISPAQRVLAGVLLFLFVTASVYGAGRWSLPVTLLAISCLCAAAVIWLWPILSADHSWQETLVWVAFLLLGVAFLLWGGGLLVGRVWPVGVAGLLPGGAFLLAGVAVLLPGAAFLLPGVAGLLWGVALLVEEAWLVGVAGLLVGVALLLWGVALLVEQAWLVGAALPLPGVAGLQVGIALRVEREWLWGVAFLLVGAAFLLVGVASLNGRAKVDQRLKSVAAELMRPRPRSAQPTQHVSTPASPQTPNPAQPG